MPESSSLEHRGCHEGSNTCKTGNGGTMHPLSPSFHGFNHWWSWLQLAVPRSCSAAEPTTPAHFPPCPPARLLHVTLSTYVQGLSCHFSHVHASFVACVHLPRHVCVSSGTLSICKCCGILSSSSGKPVRTRTKGRFDPFQIRLKGKFDPKHVPFGVPFEGKTRHVDDDAHACGARFAKQRAADAMQDAGVHLQGLRIHLPRSAGLRKLAQVLPMPSMWCRKATFREVQGTGGGWTKTERSCESRWRRPRLRRWEEARAGSVGHRRCLCGLVRGTQHRVLNGGATWTTEL